MVHYFGQPQNIEKFTDFCRQYSLLLLEDNAHGHGGKYQDNYLGTFGKIGFSSPRKNLNLNYGGILFTDNKFLVPTELSKPPFFSRI